MKNPENQTFETLLSLDLTRDELTTIKSMAGDESTINKVVTRLIREKLTDSRYMESRSENMQPINIPDELYKKIKQYADECDPPATADKIAEGLIGIGITTLEQFFAIKTITNNNPNFG